MDFNRQTYQPNQNGTPQAQQHVASSVSQESKKKGLDKKFNVGKNPVAWMLFLIVVVLVAFGLLWFFRGSSNDEIGQVNKSEYQAVFLANGQVYFGKIQSLNSSYAKITNIFYLQVNQTVQPDQNGSSQSQQNQSPTLVKLGDEIHGPEDSMVINRSQIEFWENLKPSGKVSEAIAQYYKNGGNSSPAPTSSTPAANNSSTTPSSSSSDNAKQPSSSAGTPSTTPSSSSTPSSNTTTPEAPKP